MCGIVGAIAKRNVVPILIEGLKRLEYRGYDSAGVAVLNGSLQRVRSTGRVAELEKLAQAQGVQGELGIAHTRWATHGVPSERNAHPHVSGGISVVHNGIIENHEVMRSKLRALGYEFVSDTDTEVIAHLVHSQMKGGGSLFDAVRRAGRVGGCIRDRGGERKRPHPLDRRAPRRAAVAGRGRRRNFCRLRCLRPGASHAENDLP
jgi:glucosamine--fructose-6-phosphate aminotransferase (isomerizing)